MSTPKPGSALTVEDFDMIMEAVEQRQHNWPEEPFKMSMGLIFFNIGDRFAPVSCVDETHAWEGLKSDIPKDPTGGVPKCPGGHVLMQGEGLHIGWVNESNNVSILKAKISELEEMNNELFKIKERYDKAFPNGET